MKALLSVIFFITINTQIVNAGCIRLYSVVEDPTNAQIAGRLFPYKINCLSWQKPSISNYMVAYNGNAGNIAIHEGVDYVHNDQAVMHVPVFAAADGKVVYVREGCVQSSMFARNDVARECGAGWGNHIIIQHKDAYFTRYAHLLINTCIVNVGDSVKRGQKIAIMGNSGRSDVRHLHFELGIKNTPFDPCALSQNFDSVFNPMLLLDAQELSSLKSEFAKKEQRKRFALEKNRMIDSVFALQPSGVELKKLKGACWASELIQYRSEFATNFFNSFFNDYSVYSVEYKYVVWQNLYALFPYEYIVHASNAIQNETNEKIFVLIAHYLIRSKAFSANDIDELTKKRFASWENNVYLSALKASLKPVIAPDSAMIKDLIAFCKKNKEPAIILFVSKDRNKVGEAIFINENGIVLKKGKDTLKIKMLARSVTDMPAYLTNGNTPTGVFSVKGFGVSDNVFIGKSPMLISRMPFEVRVDDFSFSKFADEKWTLEVYNRFFPDSWHTYNAKNMAYFAGKAGRSEIIVHGSTIDPQYYKDTDFYPYTPSLGCISTLELWSEDGILLKSDQQKLVNILVSQNIKQAFLYVIEI